MRKPLRVEPEAEDELREAAVWYERQRAGLGRDFIAAVDAALRDVQDDPRRSSLAPLIPEELGVRRHFVRRFVYSIYYIDMDEEIRVLAIAHGHRRPGYWQDRM